MKCIENPVSGSMHKYDPEKHRRRSIRLSNYAYDQAGAYYVTLVTKNRKIIFGEIENGEVILNEYGWIAREEWLKTSEIRTWVSMDAFVIMPNHLHGIIFINEHDKLQKEPVAQPIKREFGKPIAGSLSSIIGQYKSVTTKRINARRGTKIPVWQRNYYERIVRDQEELDKIRIYIMENPMKWESDRENPFF